MGPTPSKPEASPSTPPHAWHSTGHLRGEGARTHASAWGRASNDCGRNAWCRQAGVRWRAGFAAQAPGLNVRKLWACSGLKSSTSGLTYWSRGACTSELPAAAAASPDSVQGCDAATARLGLSAITASPPTPPGGSRCAGAACVQR